MENLGAYLTKEGWKQDFEKSSNDLSKLLTPPNSHLVRGFSKLLVGLGFTMMGNASSYHVLGSLYQLTSIIFYLESGVSFEKYRQAKKF